MEFSILLPTKDRPQQLEEAVAAICSQDFEDFELIIDNGGGTIPTFADERVRVLQRPTGLDVGGAFLNRLASHSTGRWMHVTADDNTMLEGTLSSVAKCQCAWTYGGLLISRNGYDAETIEAQPFTIEQMKIESNVPPTAFWQRSLWEEAGRFDESVTHVWDYELWVRFGLIAGPHVRAHIDYRYAIWPGQVSSVRAPEVKAEIRMLHERWRTHGLGSRQ